MGLLRLSYKMRKYSRKKRFERDRKKKVGKR